MIIVTGAAGFIGSNLVRGLNRAGAWEGKPSGKRARAAVQQAFNAWAEESGRPLSHISVTLAIAGSE